MTATMSESDQRIHILAMIGANYWVNRQMLRGVYAFAEQRPNWHVRDVDRLETIGIEGMRRWPPQGVITTDLAPKVQEALPVGVPAVGILNHLAWGDVRVLLDHRACGRMAADHLLRRGYHHFGYITTELPERPRLLWARERQAGFEEVLSVEGRTCDVFETAPAVERRQSGSPWLPVFPDLSDWLDSLEKPVGIFCSDDHRARMLVENCLGHGLRVPEDVGIVGVNGDPFECEWIRPKLTSVHMPWQRLGYEAAARLDLLLDGMVPAEERVVLQPLGLRANESTDLSAVDDPQLAAALRYIEANACRGIQVAQVCTATGIERRRLERAVAKLMGRSPYQEIQRVQCEEASYLLATTRLSVGEVAKRVGIAASRFAEVFKRSVGQPPRQYRKQHGLGGR